MLQIKQDNGDVSEVGEIDPEIDWSDVVPNDFEDEEDTEDMEPLTDPNVDWWRALELVGGEG